MNLEKYLKKIKEKNILSEENFKYLRYKHFHKGECLLSQGQEIEEIYILINGKVRTMHISSMGGSILFAIEDKMSLLGEVEFINHREVSNEVYAMLDCDCLSIDIKRYGHVLLNDNKFLRYVSSTLAERVYANGNNFSISLSSPVENRLASYLLASCNEDNIVEENFVEVASMIGCSYRQMQRVLKEFIDQKYIQKIKRSTYKIIDEESLEERGEDLYFL